MRISWGLIVCALASFAAGYLLFRNTLPERAAISSALSAARNAHSKPGQATSEATSLSRNERIAAVLAAAEDPDGLRRDHALFVALQQMQPGDFLTATSDVEALAVRDGLRKPRD